MNYAGIIKNDTAAAPGICLSFFTQGCPHRCEGCFNQETWNFNDGKEFNHETLAEILEGLTANGIQRNFCILGGEPLCVENAFLTYLVVKEVKEKLPDVKIYIWTGYTYRYLLDRNIHDKIPAILSMADYLIDGPFMIEKRDVTLRMRGSSNQKIWDLRTGVDITENF